jgi:acetylornithine deacetylase/succinyl-diaminopimelate desuccinylase-like protein
LVGNQDPKRVGDLVRQAILDRAPEGIVAKVDMGHQGAPYLVVPPGKPNSPDNAPALLTKAFEATKVAISEEFPKPALFLREGGSIPIIADIKTTLGLDSVMIGLFLPEDNLHAPNESMNIDVLKKGIRVSKSILKSLAV